MLRRIARRAIRHGYKLGARKPFFHALVAALVAEMGDAYPELRAQRQRVTDVLKQEEERFFRTIANGMEILESGAGRAASRGRRCSTATSPSSCTTPTASRSTSPPTSAASAASRSTRRASTRCSASSASGARALGKFKMAQGLEYSGGAIDLPRLRDAGARRRARVTAIYVDGTAVQTRERRRRRRRRPRPHAVLCRERRPGRRHRRAAQRDRALGRRGHDQGAGGGVRPPGPRRRRRRSRSATSSRPGSTPSGARAPCATTARRT